MPQIPDIRDIRIGKELALLRGLAHKTQAQVGLAVGVTEQQISKYERGEDRVSKSRYDSIIEFLSGEPVNGLAESAAPFITPARDLIQRAELAKVIGELEVCLGRLKALTER